MTEAQAHRTAQHKKAFLDAYSELGNILRACQVAEVGRRTYYDWMHDDADFAASFAEADEQAGDVLEAEARRRAVEGTDKPVYYKGDVAGYVREYSDTLLIFLLKGARPSKYRERVDVTMDARQEVEAFAAEAGISVEAAQAEVDRLLREHRRR